MCCIFTWMAWCFDASHRLVVFIMACLISSSVCCLLLTASLAGVAMGYNYSLAEYIDLKETNISVYIKRGVYDDEIADDFDWRRSAGGEAPRISLKDSNGMRLSPGVVGEQPVETSGRRSNSLFESEDQSKYEGGLMRLTSSSGRPEESGRRYEPPAPPYTTSQTTTTGIVDGLLQVADSMPGGSLERLKVIQAAARHHEARKIELATAQVPEDPSIRVKAIETNAQIHNARRNDPPTTTTDKYSKYFGQLAQHPGFPGSGLSARKFMENREKDLVETEPPNRFRSGVFAGELSGWPAPDSSKSNSENFFEYDANSDKSPVLTPPTIKPLLVRPLENKKPQIIWDDRRSLDSPIKLTKTEFKEYPDSKSVKFKDGLPRKQHKMYNDYDDSHGIPVRKKRSDSKFSVKGSEAISVLITRFTTQDNYLHTKVLEQEVEISTNTEDELKNGFISKSSTKSPSSVNELNLKNHSRSTNNITINISQQNLKSGHDNGDVYVDQSKVNILKHLTSFWKTKYANWKPKKRRKKSEGYGYKMFRNKEIKSVWWRISDGVCEQWNKMIVYLNKRDIPISNHSLNPKIRDNKYSNSFRNEKSTIIKKLVAISTNKSGRNQFDTTETNKGTNLDI